MVSSPAVDERSTAEAAPTGTVASPSGLINSAVSLFRATLDTAPTSRDVSLLPESSQAGPLQAPAETTMDRPDVVPPVSDFAVDVAEFLNRFLPFDPNRFQAREMNSHHRWSMRVGEMSGLGSPAD